MSSVREVDGCYVTSKAPKPVNIRIELPRPDQASPISSSTSGKVLYSTATLQSVDDIQRRKKGIGDCPVSCPKRVPLGVQTDLYLEELCDEVEEVDNWCQTDLFLDRPTTPLFIPRVTGIEKETQVWTGELFDFDEEVKPLLENLISQTLEQSVVEITAERELDDIRNQQREFEIERNVELADRFRLEEQERRLLVERRKRLREQEEAVILEEETAEKISACIYAQNYLSDLLPKVYKRLESQGYFDTQEPEIQDVEEDFWPWLMNEVDSDIATLQAACSLLDSLIEDSVNDITRTAVIRPLTPQFGDMEPAEGYIVEPVEAFVQDPEQFPVMQGSVMEPELIPAMEGLTLEPAESPTPVEQFYTVESSEADTTGSSEFTEN